MSADLHQQFVDLITRSQRPLIVLPENADVDAFASAIGLRQLFAKLKKSVPIVAANSLPKRLVPLVGSDIYTHTDIPNLNELTIELDLSAAEMGSIRHQVKDNRLRIFVTPKSGLWQDHHVSVRPSNYQFDLIISIGSPDLASHGSMATTYKDFFSQTPILNIDHSPTNTHFGQLNIVDTTATSCGEVCYALAKVTNPKLVDPDMATAFLAGMIAKTKSFKSRTVTPQTLEVAGKLLEAGARREDIMHHFYRTRTVPTLRLWGRALSRLRHERTEHLVWTILSQQDFLDAGADDSDLPEVIDELIGSSPAAETILLLYETPKGICAILRCLAPMDALKAVEGMEATGTIEEAHVRLETNDLTQAEAQLLEAIKHHHQHGP